MTSNVFCEAEHTIWICDDRYWCWRSVIHPKCVLSGWDQDSLCITVQSCCNRNRFHLHTVLTQLDIQFNSIQFIQNILLSWIIMCSFCWNKGTRPSSLKNPTVNPQLCWHHTVRQILIHWIETNLISLSGEHISLLKSPLAMCCTHTLQDSMLEMVNVAGFFFYYG